MSFPCMFVSVRNVFFKRIIIAIRKSPDVVHVVGVSVWWKLPGFSQIINIKEGGLVC